MAQLTYRLPRTGDLCIRRDIVSQSPHFGKRSPTMPLGIDLLLLPEIAPQNSLLPARVVIQNFLEKEDSLN